ncbi:hypothetical protein M426DRAFT_206521 [Hypoxylon sp. CI-4A]|nr:hypothetical protein M426DRAFT_206521 [Hypoxylon sp. CI-4A]
MATSCSERPLDALRQSFPESAPVSPDSDGISVTSHERGLYIDQEDADKKKHFFNLTVNVAGGRTSGGAASGGDGTGGTANANGGFDFRDTRDVISALTYLLTHLPSRIEPFIAPAAPEPEPAPAPVVPVDRVVIDSGTWNTAEIRSHTESRESTEGRINFSKKFKTPPRVMVSMCSADVGKYHHFRVKVYANNIDPKGFTVHADSWGMTQLYSCGVSWMAMGE